MAVAALAGRRIDAVGVVTSRFPKSSIERVRGEIESLFISENVELLVCSAASGADLLGLDIAQKLNIRCRVVLPFNASRFRKSSVVDRSGEWGPLFDTVLSKVESYGDLIVIDRTLDGDRAYGYATEVIVNTAIQAALPARALAVLIWDGMSRGDNDFAKQFLDLAIQKGMTQRVILTL